MIDQMTWMTEEHNHLHGEEKALYDCTASQEYSPGCRHTCFLVNDQEKTSCPEPQRIHHKMQTPGKPQNQKDRLQFIKI